MGVTLLFAGAIRYICCLTPQMKCVANISLNMPAWKLYFRNRFISLIDRCGCVFLFFFFFFLKTRSVVFTVEIVVIRFEFYCMRVVFILLDWIKVKDRSEKRTCFC